MCVSRRLVGGCRLRVAIASLFVLLAPAAPAAAQNLAGVPNPDIRAGEKSLEYRAAFAPESDSGPERFGHRLHYQRALGDDWRVRAFVVQTKTGDESFRLRSAGAEAHWQIFERDKAGFDGALILQGVAPIADGEAGRARLSFAAKRDAGPFDLRLGVFAAREIGANARAGVLLESRAQALLDLGDGSALGAQLFNAYNSTAHFGPFDEQRHQAGPVFTGKISNHVGFSAGVLLGLSARAPDEELRLFLTYAP